MIDWQKQLEMAALVRRLFNNAMRDDGTLGQGGNVTGIRKDKVFLYSGG